MNMKYDVDISKYDRYNIEDIARCIRETIKNYQDSLPESEIPNSAAEAEQIALRQIMKLTKGQSNPNIIMSIIQMERSVWKKGTFLWC